MAEPRPPKQARDLVASVKRHIRFGQNTLEPILSARPEPEFRDPEVRFIQPAQNTLRTCLEATLQEAGHYSDRTCIELAIRLASYAISALPLERQDHALAEVIRSLPAAHSARLAKGIVIQTEWETNGLRHANIPGGRA